jgi:two-component system sensor kinase FixL
VRFRVADNGPGFSDLQLEQLLLASTKPEGSGVGLFVVNTAVQIHGGTLQLGRSAELGGAEVILCLPAQV